MVVGCNHAGPARAHHILLPHVLSWMRNCIATTYLQEFLCHIFLQFLLFVASNVCHHANYLHIVCVKSVNKSLHSVVAQDQREQQCELRCIHIPKLCSSGTCASLHVGPGLRLAQLVLETQHGRWVGHRVLDWDKSLASCPYHQAELLLVNTPAVIINSKSPSRQS